MIQTHSLSKVTRSASFFLKAIVLNLQKRNASATRRHFWEALDSIVDFKYMYVELVFTVQSSRAFESFARRNRGNGVIQRCLYIGSLRREFSFSWALGKCVSRVILSLTAKLVKLYWTRKIYIIFFLNRHRNISLNILFFFN